MQHGIEILGMILGTIGPADGLQPQYDEPFVIFLRNVGIFALWLGGIIFVVALCHFVFWSLSAALRRQERARLFLDLLETGLKQGRSPEQTVVWLASSRDKSLDVFFYLLAAYVEQGYRLDQALEKVPGFLPRRVQALFQAGQELGDLRKILPVCQQALRDGTSIALAGQNSLGVVLFAFPIGAFMVGFFSVMIFPRLHQIAMDFIGVMPAGTEQLLRWSQGLAVFTAMVWLVFWAINALQGGGPRFLARVEGLLWSVLQRLELRLPWRYKRLQRDFSAVLGLLLDAGLPERRALQVAAEGTGNWFFLQRAQAALREMSEGAKLTEAVQILDEPGEFKWRLENAAAAEAGFASALAGWQEALDAKAFAQQQAASQLITTGLVFLNGAMVVLMGIGLFQIFLAIMEEAPLW